MKIFNGLLKLSAVAAAVLGMNACGSNSSEASSNASWDSVVAGSAEAQKKLELIPSYDMIPDNAVLAVKVMPGQLFDKTLGDPGSQGYELWEDFRDEIIAVLYSEDDMSGMLAGLIESPEFFGVSMDEPIVLSFAGNFDNVMRDEAAMEIFLTTRVADRGRFEAFVNMVLARIDSDEEVKKQVVNSTYTHYEIAKDNRDGVALDMALMGDIVVARFTADTIDGISDLKTSMQSLFANYGPKKTEGLLDFYASQADMAVWIDLERGIDLVLPVLKAQDPTTAAQLEQFMPLYKGASFVTDLTFMDGKTVLEMRTFGSDALKANAVKYNTSSSDKFFNHLPYTSAVVVNVAIKDFPGLVDQLCATNADYAEAFEMLELYAGLDKSVYAGFPGVMTMALDGEGLDDRDIPGFALCMECKENVWDLIREYLGEIASKVGANKYSIQGEVYVSYNGDAVIMTDKNTERKIRNGYRTFAEAPMAHVVRNSGMMIDLNNIPRNLISTALEEVGDVMTVNEFLEFISSASITVAPDFMTSTLTLNMNDKQHNLLEKLVLFIAEHPELMEQSYDYDDYGYYGYDYDYDFDYGYSDTSSYYYDYNY